MFALGVDPGGTWTGLVARRGDELVEFAVLRRPAGQDDRTWVSRVLEESRWLAALRATGEPMLVAVESLNPPIGRMGMITLTGLIGAAAVYGAVLGEYPAAVTVAPGGHGSAPLGAYPQQLRGAREKQGTGRWRHARSAWDVAGAAVFLAKVTAR
jgi:hypothetical protein